MGLLTLLLVMMTSEENGMEQAKSLSFSRLIVDINRQLNLTNK